MNTETIRKIRAGKEKARIYNHNSYQESGEPRYERAERRYEELVDICDIALNVSEIRDRSIRMNADYMSLAMKAAELKHKGLYRDPDKMNDFLYELVDTAERFGFKDMYK